MDAILTMEKASGAANVHPPPPSGHGDILNHGGSSSSRSEKADGGKKRGRPPSVTTTHGTKFRHLEKRSSSTRRSTSPNNFKPAPATCTPKRPCSTSQNIFPRYFFFLFATSAVGRPASVVMLPSSEYVSTKPK